MDLNPTAKFSLRLMKLCLLIKCHCLPIARQDSILIYKCTVELRAVRTDLEML